MKLIPVKENLKITFYKKTKWLDIIDEFVNSEMKCAKLEGWTNKTSSSAASACNISIKRFNKKGIKAIERKGEVFLVKE